MYYLTPAYRYRACRLGVATGTGAVTGAVLMSGGNAAAGADDAEQT
jgi:hypothetical protein